MQVEVKNRTSSAARQSTCSASAALPEKGTGCPVSPYPGAGRKTRKRGPFRAKRIRIAQPCCLPSTSAFLYVSPEKKRFLDWLYTGRIQADQYGPQPLRHGPLKKGRGSYGLQSNLCKGFGRLYPADDRDPERRACQSGRDVR